MQDRVLVRMWGHIRVGGLLLINITEVGFLVAQLRYFNCDYSLCKQNIVYLVPYPT